MLMYLEYGNFLINKNILQIESKESIIIVSFLSEHCIACRNAKETIYKLSRDFTQINFAILYLDYNNQVIDILNKVNISINNVPKFAFFKLGNFVKFLDMNIISKENINYELKFELNNIESSIINDIKPNLKYKKFYEL